jgi:LysM repeat protein
LRALASGAGALAAFLLTALPAYADTTYVVRWGDSLSSIAVHHHTTVRTLARLNGIHPDRVLLAGTALRLPSHGASAPPPAARYRVRVGDTLTAIAADYRVGLVTLARANHMRVNGVLVAGRVLKIPGAGEARVTLGGRYRVRVGDTLSGIAASYGMTLSALAHANHLNPSRYLIAGSVLRVPERATTESSATTSSIAASGSPVVTGPVLSRLAVRGLIDKWAAHYGVPPSLARALAWQESGYQTTLTSVAGASGVMQVTPDTWSYVETILIGQTVPHTADGNIRVGVAYLASLLSQFGGDQRRAVAAYYQGARSVMRRGILPETKTYVANVLALETRV